MIELFLTYIINFGPTSYYARLPCTDFAVPIMVYDMETDRLRPISYGGRFYAGYSRITGQAAGGCVAA